jgi:nucleotide-binding universal stress UspA family protein
MPRFRTILVAADFSGRSAEAFRVACELAHEQQTRLFVLHVVEPEPVTQKSVYFGQLTEPFLAIERGPGYDAALKDRLRDAYAPGRPVEVEYLVRDGVPAEAVLEVASQVGADLIVMGTHGRTGLRRLLAGSVAEAVLRRAPCPVLALSAPEPPLAGGRTPTILHPTDLSDGAQAALEVARDLARDRGARLVLLHVLPVAVVHCRIVPLEPDVPAVRAALEGMAWQASGPDLKYPVEVRLTQGGAAAGILRVIRETGCSLIVMGTHGRSGLGRLLMGSVAEAVVRGAPCPVLTVRARRRATARATEEARSSTSVSPPGGAVDH